MSEHNKKDKDSYAKDTLAFTIPPEERRRTQGQPKPNRNSYPHEQNPQQYFQHEQYPQGYDQNDPYYNEQYSQKQRSQRQYPQAQQPQSQRSQGQYPQGNRMPKQSSQDQQPQSQRSQGQYPQGNRMPKQSSQVQRPPSQRSQGQYSQGNRTQGQRPQNKKPKPQNTQKSPAKRTVSGNQQKPVKQKAKKSRRRFGCLTKIIISLLSILIVIFVIYSVVALSLISKVTIDEEGERGTASHSLYTSSSVRNILLIGTDSRGEDRGRSDSMILLSINSKTNKMSLVSLMRDSYVQIPGYGGDKLNAAYSYGGPELLMDTIEENFYIEIDDYFTVNFISFANIVDAVGGVEIEVTDDEADAINVLLDSKEGQTLFGTPDESDYLNGGGKYKLNGKQALCYSRLRYVGNADFERTERQRKVLTQILKSAGTMNPFKLGTAAKDVLPSMNTNMSKMSMYLLSLRLPSLLIGYDIDQIRIPAENTYYSSTIDGQSVLEIDINANLEIIEKELY